MKRNLFKISVIGFIFVGVLGTLCHFVFEWSGYNRLVALLCPVNESSWEHLKLIFFPYLIWTVAERIILKENIIFSKAVGIVTGMLSTLMFYYTYTGITGKNIDFLNILSFFIGLLVAFAVDYFMIKSGKFNEQVFSISGVVIFVLLAAVFFLFTFAPPLIPLFRDPTNFTYGI